MIINCIDLSQEDQNFICKKLVDLSNQEGTSLLPRTIEETYKAILDRMLYAKIIDDVVVFIVAFEPTGNSSYIEVGMTCNFAPESNRGKEMFPEIITHYRNHNGNSSHTLYLTTNDIRMIKIAENSGFTQITNHHSFLPCDVVAFCCEPCKPNKTGVAIMGQQITHCPRFHGEFVPEDCNNLTRLPCKIFAQIVQ